MSTRREYNHAHQTKANNSRAITLSHIFQKVENIILRRLLEEYVCYISRSYSQQCVHCINNVPENYKRDITLSTSFVFKNRLQLLGTYELRLCARFQINIFDDGTTVCLQKIAKTYSKILKEALTCF